VDAGLKRMLNLARSVEGAILDDYLIFDVSPFVLKSMVQLGSVGIQTGPDYIRAIQEPATTLMGETGDISKGLGKLTNLLG